MTKTLTHRYDVADHLRTPEEISAYLEACIEEGDEALVAKALADVARARAAPIWQTASAKSRAGAFTVPEDFDSPLALSDTI